MEEKDKEQFSVAELASKSDSPIPTQLLENKTYAKADDPAASPVESLPPSQSAKETAAFNQKYWSQQNSTGGNSDT